MTETSTFIENPSELDDARGVAIAAGMVAQGVNPVDRVQVDYFAPEADVVTTLADGISWVSHKKMNEGDRKRYLKKVNRDLKIQKGTGDAIMRLAGGEERTALLETAITGWNLLSGGNPLPFTPQNLARLLDGPIEVLERVEKDVRKNNPWLESDVTVEDIDAEIESLQERRQEVLEREEGNGGSAN